jgi:hypothetical protein
MAASAKSRRACGPSFVFLARPRSCDALKSPRNATGIVMTNLHRSPPLNQSKIDLGIVNESQLLRLGIRQAIVNYNEALKGLDNKREVVRAVCEHNAKHANYLLEQVRDR